MPYERNPGLQSPESFWAKTVEDGQPGISVRNHCVNVGCVAEALLAGMSRSRRALLPTGAATLAALHDVGKISTGFQAKCPAWLEQMGLAEAAGKERWTEGSESDHAVVSQYFLERMLKPLGLQLWAVAAGVHHGRIVGKRIPGIHHLPKREAWERVPREALLAELVGIFGGLPIVAPLANHADLWDLAGLISVADWIGSNEAFFPAGHGLPLEESRAAAGRALENIRWRGGEMAVREFGELFAGYAPMPLQAALHGQCEAPGLFIVEGPMGCGKTEAALWAAHRLIAAGANEGMYFALPTQVTSNRIHLRVAPFLQAALAEASNLRLAHAASWLEEWQTWRLHPTSGQDTAAAAHVREGRSWFASSKHAMLARYGVGTVDQALQGVVAVKHFFVRRFGLAGKVVILDEVHSYDVYTGTLLTQLVRELLALGCSVIVLSATLTLARRRELVAAAGGNEETVQSLAYPLLTVARGEAPVVELAVEPGPSRTIRLRSTTQPEWEILQECIERAEAGQHVLYLRNTVVEAQDSCRKLAGAVRAERVVVGTLHSRFPFFRRQQLEEEWLNRLGKHRAEEGPGSLLVATQVVEQSVDIDLDFIVSDLAPTDMLLQRMGRLWRHQRVGRKATEPEFWISTPGGDREADAKTLRRELGKSGLVYAPYVLLRTAEVFADRDALTLPGQIREVLEATYAERGEDEKPDAWKELRIKLEDERKDLAGEANSMTKVFVWESADDDREYRTRRKGPPTRDVVLLTACELLERDRWRLTTLEGETLEVSGYAWSLAAARAVHRNLVRAPRHTVPDQEMPTWLKLHTHGPTFWALVGEDGALHFPEATGPTALAYDDILGLHTRAMPTPTPRHQIEDDDEFDY